MPDELARSARIDQREKLIGALLALLSRAVDYIEEVHEDELRERHYGDISCSCCTLIAEAKHIIKTERMVNG